MPVIYIYRYVTVTVTTGAGGGGGEVLFYKPSRYGYTLWLCLPQNGPIYFK